MSGMVSFSSLAQGILFIRLQYDKMVSIRNVQRTPEVAGAKAEAEAAVAARTAMIFMVNLVCKERRWKYPCGEPRDGLSLLLGFAGWSESIPAVGSASNARLLVSPCCGLFLVVDVSVLWRSIRVSKLKSLLFVIHVNVGRVCSLSNIPQWIFFPRKGCQRTRTNPSLTWQIESKRPTVLFLSRRKSIMTLTFRFIWLRTTGHINSCHSKKQHPDTQTRLQ